MRYLVGLSGGVDSSTAIERLKSQGHTVEAATLVMAHGDVPVPGPDALDRARETCRILEVPLEVRDVSDLFEAQVVEPFCDGYLHGATPSPCILCNQRVKLRALVDIAREKGLDAVATGHYARKVVDRRGRPFVERAQDAAKDQSYFLCLLTADQLSMVEFPLAELSKGEVRSEAARGGLPAATVKDSQGVCFAPDGDYRALIASRRPEGFRLGEIVDGEGRVLGTHRGVAGYTIGQRKGLGLGGGPWFVTALDPEGNRVVVERVGQPRETSFTLEAANLLVEPGELSGRTWDIQTHHRAPTHPGTVEVAGVGSLKVELLDGGALVVRGQVAAIYDGPRVVGGGIIG